MLPLLGGIMLLVAFIKTVLDDADAANSDTEISLFGWHTGGIFVISVGSLLLGVVLMLITQARSPRFFTGEVLNRDTEVRVLEGADAHLVLTPALPDAPSQEQTVIPPRTPEQLREDIGHARHHDDE